MPRTYVDNAYNRSHGRVGMSVGSAVISNSSSGGPSVSSSSSGSRSVSSSTGGTYVDNAYNQRLGRVDMEYGTAVVSKSSETKSMASKGSEERCYVDSSMNRSLGRVGLPVGSAVHSSSSMKSSSGSEVHSTSVETKSHGTYVDNAFNRRLGRVGLPLGSVPHSKSDASPAKITYADNEKNRRLNRAGKTIEDKNSEKQKVYVDNAVNRKLGRVGMPLGSMSCSTKKYVKPQVEEIFKPLEYLDIERDDVQRILQKILEEKERACEDQHLRTACEQAEGIIHRHEAAHALDRSKVSKPVWMNGGEVINFSDLELGDKIGSGGFANVHVAIWKQKYKVAAKVLRVQRVPKAKKEQFQEEVRLYSTLDNPAIVRFYGACVETPKLAIVMEFMEEGSLYDVLHIENIQLTDKQKYNMINDLFSGLDYLHSKAVAHRDIKSMNALVCNGYSNCKLADFGLALKEESDISASVADATVVGTFRYSPPEVLEGDRLTFEQLIFADVYSMAITVVELLTQVEPFTGLNVHQTRRAIIAGERPSLETVELPGSLRLDLTDCMSKAVDRRPTAAEFLARFREYTSGARV